MFKQLLSLAGKTLKAFAILVGVLVGLTVLFTLFEITWRSPRAAQAARSFNQSVHAGMTLDEVKAAAAENGADETHLYNADRARIAEPPALDGAFVVQVRFNVFGGLSGERCSVAMATGRATSVECHHHAT